MLLYLPSLFLYSLFLSSLPLSLSLLPSFLLPMSLLPSSTVYNIALCFIQFVDCTLIMLSFRLSTTLIAFVAAVVVDDTLLACTLITNIVNNVR